MVIRHSCDNPACINPAHLSSGTAADNMLDRDTRFRHGAAKLTVAQVKEIRQLFKENPKLPAKVITEKYGIRPSTVYSLKLGQHWKLID